jgi:hypothetical protein
MDVGRKIANCFCRLITKSENEIVEMRKNQLTRSWPEGYCHLLLRKAEKITG